MYWLFLLVGLLYRHTVTANEQPSELNELKERIDELEKMLYKVLAVTGHNDICSLNSDADCLNGDINCTSIDLLAKESECRVCVKGTWISFNPCMVDHETNEVVIDDKDKGIYIEIDKSGATVGNITNDTVAFKVPTLECNCVWSKYKFTRIKNDSNLTVDGQNQFLFCEHEESQHYYCLREGTEKDAACYEREGICTVKNQKMTCITKKHGSNTTESYLAMNKNCGKIKELSECNITVSINDEHIDISNNKWDDGNADVSCTNTNPPCIVPVSNLCTKANSINDCKNKPATNSDSDEIDEIDDDDDDDDDDSPNYTSILIIIIAILLLLFVSYYGYQNQWHQKISSCVNGTGGESQSRPVPSNRRGRMKGKYAPLPRSMEENIPRHDD